MKEANNSKKKKKKKANNNNTEIETKTPKEAVQLTIKRGEATKPKLGEIFYP